MICKLYADHHLIMCRSCADYMQIMQVICRLYADCKLYADRMQIRRIYRSYADCMQITF